VPPLLLLGWCNGALRLLQSWRPGVLSAAGLHDFWRLWVSWVVLGPIYGTGTYPLSIQWGSAWHAMGMPGWQQHWRPLQVHPASCALLDWPRWYHCSQVRNCFGPPQCKKKVRRGGGRQRMIVVLCEAVCAELRERVSVCASLAGQPRTAKHRMCAQRWCNLSVKEGRIVPRAAASTEG